MFNPVIGRGDKPIPDDAPLTSAEAVAAYRLMFGRWPESDELVSRILSESGLTLEVLGQRMLMSQECGHRLALVRGGSSEYFLNEVETQVSSEELEEMFDYVAGQWAALGESDPYWSVLTNEAFRGQVLDEATHDEFYASGSAWLDSVVEVLSCRGLVMGPSVLDFGCGTGRLSIAMSRAGLKVHAVDVSPGNLAIAEREASRQRADFHGHLLSHPSDINSLPEVDAVVSLITFQHNPPPLQRYLLKELLGRLAPAGVFIGQFFVWDEGYGWKLDDWRQVRNSPGVMDMHCLPMHVILEELHRANLRPVELFSDGSTGLGRSMTVIAKRGSPSAE